MKKLLGIIVLILSFSANHLTYAQQDCHSDCNCRQSWEVLDYGCQFTYNCYDSAHLSCEPVYNHCCYFEWGICSISGCGSTFYFRKCFLDTCNY